MKSQTKLIIAAIIIVAIILVYVGYTFAKSKSVKIPGDGSDIPPGWEPLPTVIKIHDAMDGFGTDESAFFNTLEPLTIGQRAVVYNAYNQKYGSIIKDISDEFSGDELTRALSYFKDIPGIQLRHINYYGYLSGPKK